MDEITLTGGSENPGLVVRIGDTVRRPRNRGSEAIEAFLVHLGAAGFTGAPEFLGIDDRGRQVLRYLEGNAADPAPWQQDDRANAAHLGRVAAELRELHDASIGFEPPVGCAPLRPLAIAGNTWTHGDVGYSNLVYDGDRLVGLIDWEFAGPGHRGHDLAAMLAVSVRGPKLGASDNERRRNAVELAEAAIVEGYHLDDEAIRALPSMAASVIDDMLVHWQLESNDPALDAWRWRADWFRSIGRSPTA